MKYRSRTEIAAQILEVASAGTTKTKIMYRAFLSYGQLKDYLGILLENGLLNLDQNKQTYKTTEKGKKFVQIYNQMDELATLGIESETSAPRVK